MAKWRKGESGNPRGRPPKPTSMAEIFRRIGSERSSPRSAVSNRERIVRKAYTLATGGDTTMIRLIFAYELGLPTTFINLEAKIREQTTGTITILELHRLAGQHTREEEGKAKAKAISGVDGTNGQ